MSASTSKSKERSTDLQRNDSSRSDADLQIGTDVDWQVSAELTDMLSVSSTSSDKLIQDNVQNPRFQDEYDLENLRNEEREREIKELEEYARQESQSNTARRYEELNERRLNFQNQTESSSDINYQESAMYTSSTHQNTFEETINMHSDMIESGLTKSEGSKSLEVLETITNRAYR